MAAITTMRQIVTRRDCPRDRSINSKTTIRAAANSSGIHSGDMGSLISHDLRAKWWSFSGRCGALFALGTVCEGTADIFHCPGVSENLHCAEMRPARKTPQQLHSSYCMSCIEQPCSAFSI